MPRPPAGALLIRVLVPSENVTREIVIRARLEGNTLVIEAPNYRAELSIGTAVVKTPRYEAQLDTEDVMEIDDITIDHMDPEDWEELITAIASNGDVEGVLGRIIATRGVIEEGGGEDDDEEEDEEDGDEDDEEWWEEDEDWWEE
jgi:hypothetical protein